MKKYLAGGLAAVAIAMPAAALAQTPAPVVTTSGKVSKSNAGTAKKPTPVKFTFKAINSGASQTTVSRIILEMPLGVKLDGSRLPTCTFARLEASGPSVCPRGARLGTGIAYASLVNKTRPAPECPNEPTNPNCLVFETTFFVGGKRLLNVWLQQQNGNVAKPLQGRISRSGRQLSIDIPRDLQQPAPGVYSALQQLSGSWYARKKVGRRTYSFVSTTACPGRRQWAFRTTFLYAPNPDAPLVPRRSAEERQRCTK